MITKKRCTLHQMEEILTLDSERRRSQFDIVVDSQLQLQISIIMRKYCKEDIYVTRCIRDVCIIHIAEYRNPWDCVKVWKQARQMIANECHDEKQRKRILADWDNERWFFQDKYDRECKKLVNSAKNFVNEQRKNHIFNTMPLFDDWMLRKIGEIEAAEVLFYEGKMDYHSFYNFWTETTFNIVLLRIHNHIL